MSKKTNKLLLKVELKTEKTEYMEGIGFYKEPIGANQANEDP